MEGDSPDRDRQPRGGAHDAVRRGLHQERRAPGRPGRQAAGRHQPREHRLLDQALHGPQVRARCSEEQKMVPYKVVRGATTATSASRSSGKIYSPPEISAMILQKMRERGRGSPGREGDAGGDHRARLLQRLPAPGHQGRGQDRRPGGAAHRQRAHRRGAGLRPRQEEGRDHRRLRPRRRDLRHLRARGGRRRGRGQGHQRRHPPRRRRPRPAGHRLDRRRVQEGPGHRPGQGQDGPPAPQGGRGEGQAGAVHDRWRPRSTSPSSPPTPPDPSTSP